MTSQADTGHAHGPSAIARALRGRARPSPREGQPLGLGTLAELWDRARRGRVVPLATVILSILAIWLLAATAANWGETVRQLSRSDEGAGFWATVTATWGLGRPVVPSPQQLLGALYEGVFGWPITHARSLIYHAWVTAASALTGFAVGTTLGIVLAIGIVHVRTLEKSLMPWVIASQTIPILAIAPMIVVILGNIGISGLLPKAVISTYLCFFPVTVGMVKGLRAPDPLHLDLMRTYSATTGQILAKLRWPTAQGYLFAGLKVAVAISLVGAIIAELPTGAQSGLGARLLQGSYYGQMVQMWAALAMASILGLTLVTAVTALETAVRRAMGGRFA